MFREVELRLIEEFIKEHGVTRCPTQRYTQHLLFLVGSGGGPKTEPTVRASFAPRGKR